MVRLSVTQKKQALENALRSFKFPKKYFMQQSDARLGQKFAVASNGSSGSLNVHTNFMTYDEMNCFLMGYNMALTKPFK